MSTNQPFIGRINYFFLQSTEKMELPKIQKNSTKPMMVEIADSGVSVIIPPIHYNKNRVRTQLFI